MKIVATSTSSIRMTFDQQIEIRPKVARSQVMANPEQVKHPKVLNTITYRQPGQIIQFLLSYVRHRIHALHKSHHLALHNVKPPPKSTRQTPIPKPQQ